MKRYIVDSSSGYYSSFILKIFVDEHGVICRGNLQHVGTQESICFTSLEKMPEFIMCHLSPSQNSFSAPDEDVELAPVAHALEIASENFQKQL